MADIEGGKGGVEAPADKVIYVTDLSVYTGSTVEQKTEAFTQAHAVVVISKTWCPFSLDVKDLLANQIGVTVYALEVNTHPEGAAVFKHLSQKHKHDTVPMVFINGQFIGGCDSTKALYQSGELELVHLKGLIQRKQTINTDRLETARLIPKERSVAYNPPFWFPNQVNNLVVRFTGLQVFIISAISAGASYDYVWGRYLAVGLLVDFCLRMVVGSSLSPLGMVSFFIASFFKPDFKPGPPKQFASFCGVMFSFLGTLFYFLKFNGHVILGQIFMAMLACAAGLEGFADFCLGCLFFSYGIQFGLIPDSVYRIYTSSRQEIVDSWEYRFGDSHAPVPTRVDTDPNSAVSYKYIKKTDEWTKDDFDIVRHMQIDYFGMPLAIGGLATAFKIASKWSNATGQVRRTVVQDDWQKVFGFIGAFFFCVFFALYTAKALLYPRKVAKEWDSPFKSSGFGLVTITITLYGFLVYDQIVKDPTGKESGDQTFARVLWWVGSVGHGIMTIMKFGEWVGRRLELEHVQPTWMIFPVGLAISAMVAPIVGVFKYDPTNFNKSSVGNDMIAQFFYSFAWLMWISLFVITLFKTITTHNSDDRLRHGVWVWVAAPSVLALAEFVICFFPTFNTQCNAVWVDKYFMALWIFFGFIWATFPHLQFFGNDDFGMGYWTEVFAIDTVAACASLFYATTGWKFSEVVEIIFLTTAAIANMTAFLHTMSAIVRQRGVFTPEVKWGPLSFMKLTHEAFRGNMATLRHYIDTVDVENESAEGKETLGLFAAHFNRFVIVHEEHARHEDSVIFKTFNDFFTDVGKPWNDDHSGDHKQLEAWRVLANTLLDQSLSLGVRKAALDELRRDVPRFFEHFETHLKGEEDNLAPVARKYLPIALTVQIARSVWEITDAKKWEVIIPFIILGLPRHQQRIRYVKIMTWSLPERAQQIGAIIYRNVDAVMWERLRTVCPEIIPRGAPGFMRYY